MSDDFVLLYPDEKTPRIYLVDLLREAHEDNAERRRVEIARRKKHGIPLDDMTEWPAVKDAAAAVVVAVAAKSYDDILSALEVVRARTSSPLRELAPFVIADPRLSSVTIELQTMSASLRGRIRARMLTLINRQRAELEKDLAVFVNGVAAPGVGANTETVVELEEAIIGTQVEFVRATVKHLGGLRRARGDGSVDVDSGFDLGKDDAVDALRRALLDFGTVDRPDRLSFLSLLYRVADRFQDLAPGKAMRSGQRLPST